MLESSSQFTKHKEDPMTHTPITCENSLEVSSSTGEYSDIGGRSTFTTATSSY